LFHLLYRSTEPSASIRDESFFLMNSSVLSFLVIIPWEATHLPLAYHFHFESHAFLNKDFFLQTRRMKRRVSDWAWKMVYVWVWAPSLPFMLCVDLICRPWCVLHFYLGVFATFVVSIFCFFVRSRWLKMLREKLFFNNRVIKLVELLKTESRILSRRCNSVIEDSFALLCALVSVKSNQTIFQERRGWKDKTWK